MERFGVLGPPVALGWAPPTALTFYSATYLVPRFTWPRWGTTGFSISKNNCFSPGERQKGYVHKVQRQYYQELYSCSALYSLWILDSVANNKSKKPVGLEPRSGISRRDNLGLKICLPVMVLYITNMAIWIKNCFFFLQIETLPGKHKLITIWMRQGKTGFYEYLGSHTLCRHTCYFLPPFLSLPVFSEFGLDCH